MRIRQQAATVAKNALTSISRGLKNWPALIAIATLAVGVSGCSTLPSALSTEGVVSQNNASPAALAATGADPLFLVDVQVPFSGGKKYKGVIAPGGTVQSALDESGVTQKHRTIDVAVMRKVKGEYKPLKMTCEFDSTARKIVPETDYALKHGDRIVVTPKTKDSGLLELLGSFNPGK